MIGAREEELGRTRSQKQEMMSPRNESMERAEMTMEDWIHETCLISAVTSGPTEPQTFQEAWHSPVEEERNNWQIAIKKEINRKALARMIVEKLDSLVMDVETAFLYGDIEEEIFIKSPVGMEEIDPGSSPQEYYQLKKGINGLCKGARQFWKTFVDTIRKEPFGFTDSSADPCMLFKENNLGICIIIMYVDDMLIIGKRE